MMAAARLLWIVVCLAAAPLLVPPAAAQQPTPAAPAQPFEPRVGQPGKDVVWVPTPPSLVELMLDMAKLTRDDFVMDLGSGDGRNIIAAARRGARGVGVEYNPDMVTLATRLAREAGVQDRATFVQGDMYEADISKANVMAIFLLTTNMDKLMPSFKSLAPGSRIVSNTFSFSDWDADARESVKDGSCASWCESLLWIVPAEAAGTWMIDGGTLTLTQIAPGAVRHAGHDRRRPADLEGPDARLRHHVHRRRPHLHRPPGPATTMQGSVTGPDGTQTWKATKVARAP